MTSSPTTTGSSRPATSGIAKQPVPACPVCDSPDRTALYPVREHEYTTSTDDNFPLVSCIGCGAWYLDPRPADSTLGVIYPPNYYSYVLEKQAAGDVQAARSTLAGRLRKHLIAGRLAPVRRYAEFSSQLRWLDVGCGTGEVLDSVYHVYGARGEGLDLSPEAVRLCRERGFEAQCTHFEDYAPECNAPYQLIHSSHVIEHVPSPRDFCRKAWELLEPGGLHIFFTPNTDTWEARAFGRHWGGLHAPRHWALLHQASARRLGEQAGFEYLDTIYSANGMFWNWSFHSMLSEWLPRGVSDALFPSDHRWTESTLWNIARIGGLSFLDQLNRILTRRTANMLVIFRKPD